METRGGEEDEGEEDSDSDQEMSAKVRYFGYVKQGLYLVTEMERFAPLRKRPRTITKHYRLVSLRSTTPEELYQRKVRECQVPGKVRCHPDFMLSLRKTNFSLKIFKEELSYN